ncbi:MAG: DUF1223 domain-containing protein [Terriglobales bacterium]
MRQLLLCVALMTIPAAQAAECSARSGANSTALVELYTSEGCDSCPPADRWLSSLAQGFDPARVVPVAFHVDYWDYIGWKDPFASAAFSERQRSGVRISGGRIVYTPQVLFGGKDFRAWSSAASFRDALTSANAKPARADLELRARIAGSDLEVSALAKLKGAALPADHALLVAITESRLVSAVKAGENRGVTLAHDHVVRELKSYRRFDASERFVLRPGWKRENLAVVAFVQNLTNGEVLQALRLPACPE